MSIEVEKPGCAKSPVMESLQCEGEEDFDLEEVSGTNKVSNPCVSSKRKSAIWIHFRRDLSVEKGKNNVICNYCGAKYTYNVDNGTSAMWKHLKKCNKFPRNIDKKQRLFAARRVDTSQETQMTMGLGNTSTCSASSSFLSTWKFDQDLCRQMLVRMIIVDEQPFSMVERVGFRDFINQLQPLFNPISRFTVSSDCMKLYHSERTSLKTYFCKLDSRVALTTDSWTSIQNLNYLCLTAHFIDENWKLNKRIINFVVMHSHKGKDIGRMIDKCIYEWGLEKKISTITVDNASSNDVAIGFLKEKLSKGKLLILDGAVLHMRCPAHILNLIVRDGLTEVRDSITRIPNVVRYVRSSPMRAKIFQDCIERARVTYKGSVCLDVTTRWNSTYLMLDTALKFRTAFEQMEEDDISFSSDLDFDTPKHENWENARILSIFLKKFYDATNKMSGTLYVTTNDYFGGIATLYKTLKHAENSTEPRLKAMGMKMKDKFDKYYGSFDKVNMMVLVAVILDPRRKLNYVQYCYKLIYDDDDVKVDEMCNKVRIALEGLFHFYDKSSRNSSNKELGGQLSKDIGSSCSWDLDSHEGNRDMLDSCELELDFDIDQKFEMFLGEKRKVSDASLSELDRYLNAEREECRHLDLLMWWKTTGKKFKVFSLMARDILAIPVTTVASESTFSTSGRVLDGFRSSLTPKVVEALICTQDWLRAIDWPIDVEECIENSIKFECDMDDVHSELTGK